MKKAQVEQGSEQSWFVASSETLYCVSSISLSPTCMHGYPENFSHLPLVTLPPHN